MLRIPTAFRLSTVRCLKPVTRAMISLAMFATTGTLSLIFAGHLTRANADTGCTASTIAGTYVFDLRGFLRPFLCRRVPVGGDFFRSRQRAPGFLTARRPSRPLVASVGGNTFPDPDTVNSDCTPAATFEDGTWYMVIAAHGKEIKSVNSTGGRAVAAALTQQLAVR